MNKEKPQMTQRKRLKTLTYESNKRIRKKRVTTLCKLRYLKVMEIVQYV